MEGQSTATGFADAAGQTVAAVNAMVAGFFALLPQMIIALVVFVAMLFVASFVRSLVVRTVSSRAPHSVGVALGRLAHIGVVFAAIIVAIAVVAPSVGAAEILGVLGVGSVAIGFAFRDILQNFLAGLIILLGRPFSEGDWIRYGDFEGNVTDISTRSTWMRTFDGRDVTIPNAELFTNPVTIMTRSPMIRSDYEFGVSYAADIDKAIGTILAAIKSVEAVSEEQPPDAGVSDLAGSSVNIKARWWTKTGDAYGAKLAVMKAVKQALDEAEIEIPFPQRDINLSRDVVRELKRAS